MPPRSGFLRTWRSREKHSIAGIDLVKKLQQQQRYANHVNEAEHRVVVCARNLIALRGSQAEGGMLAGVEKFRRSYRPAEAVEHLNVDIRLGIRGDTRDD